MKICKLYDLTHTQAKEFLSEFTYPWECIKNLKDFIAKFGRALNKEEYKEVSPEVWIHRSARISETSKILAPCIIGAETEVRHCAFIRGSVIIGKNCVIGNSTEIKNSILFDNVQVPHFNYIGDSILGFKAHMGAGAITSNVKCDKSLIEIRNSNLKFYTGLKKLGAFLGDRVEVGCNSVLNPGTVIGKNSTIYPLSSVRGTIPPDSIYKNGHTVIKR